MDLHDGIMIMTRNMKRINGKEHELTDEVGKGFTVCLLNKEIEEGGN